MWVIENELLNTENTIWINDVFTVPYPVWLWKIDSTKDNGLPINDLIPNDISLFSIPYSVWLWRIENGKITNELLTEIEELGAFCHAYKLKKISIPDSVKKIGRFAFRYTALTLVKIADDCEYYETSFPDECKIIGGIMI